MSDVLVSTGIYLSEWGFEELLLDVHLMTLVFGTFCLYITDYLVNYL